MRISVHRKNIMRSTRGEFFQSHLRTSSFPSTPSSPPPSPYFRLGKGSDKTSRNIPPEKNVLTTSLFQCFIFERGNQKVSKGCLAILLGIAIFIAVTLILAAVSVITWLDMLYYFSYVKLGITIIKWVKDQLDDNP